MRALGDNFLLWQDDRFMIKTPMNPHQPYSEGLHLIVVPSTEHAAAWDDPDLAAETFKLAARVCRIIVEEGFSPWCNIQANGNWGLLPGAKPFFHVHIFGRNKTKSWGKPIVLPELPGTYQNDPMPEYDRTLLTNLVTRAFE